MLGEFVILDSGYPGLRVPSFLMCSYNVALDIPEMPHFFGALELLLLERTVGWVRKLKM